MRPIIFSICLLVLSCMNALALVQDVVVAGNKVRISFVVTIAQKSDTLMYNYTALNSEAAEQEAYRFFLLPPGKGTVWETKAPTGWRAAINKKDGLIINYVAFKGNLMPGSSLEGFSFKCLSLPGIITFYAEGEHAVPKFPPGMAPDSIPGYDDITPYGPGVIGKTVGPAMLSPVSFDDIAFLDTLLSYTRQSAELGWLGRDPKGAGRDDDCDNDEKPEDGIARNIDQRLKKAKKELQRRDSVLARRELEKLVSKVERLWKRSQDNDKKDKRDRWEKRDKVVMTSEAYALLKYNTEYLIDRLPDGKSKKGSKDKD